jgi:hypothetical protein
VINRLSKSPILSRRRGTASRYHALHEARPLTFTPTLDSHYLASDLVQSTNQRCERSGHESLGGRTQAITKVSPANSHRVHVSTQWLLISYDFPIVISTGLKFLGEVCLHNLNKLPGGPCPTYDSMRGLSVLSMKTEFDIVLIRAVDNVSHDTS